MRHLEQIRPTFIEISDSSSNPEQPIYIYSFTLTKPRWRNSELLLIMGGVSLESVIIFFGLLGNKLLSLCSPMINILQSNWFLFALVRLQVILCQGYFTSLLREYRSSSLLCNFIFFYVFFGLQFASDFISN